MSSRLHRETRPASGFSLVELLVVVSIIALLVALLLPALGKAKFHAQTINCLSRIRGTAIGTQMYTGDNNGYFVPLQVAGYDYGGWRLPTLPYMGLGSTVIGSIYSPRYRALQCTGWAKGTYLGGLGNHYTFSHNYDLRNHWESKSVSDEAWMRSHRIEEVKDQSKAGLFVDAGMYASAIHHPHIEEYGLRGHPTAGPGHAPPNHEGLGLSMVHVDGSASFEYAQEPGFAKVDAPWRYRSWWGVPKGLGWGKALAD